MEKTALGRRCRGIFYPPDFFSGRIEYPIHPDISSVRRIFYPGCFILAPNFFNFFIRPDRISYRPGYFILGYFIRMQDIFSSVPRIFYPGYFIPFACYFTTVLASYPPRPCMLSCIMCIIFGYFVSPSSLHAFKHHVHNFWLLRIPLVPACFHTSCA